MRVQHFKCPIIAGSALLIVIIIDRLLRRLLDYRLRCSPCNWPISGHMKLCRIIMLMLFISPHCMWSPMWALSS